MQTSLRMLRGEQLTLTEETKALYDITPEWTDEAIFAQNKGNKLQISTEKRNCQKQKATNVFVSISDTCVATYGDLYNKRLTRAGTVLSVPIPNPHCEA